MTSRELGAEVPVALGLTLARSADWVTLAFDRPRPCLSSAPVNGGLGSASRWLNLKVARGEASELESPTATVARLCARQGWPTDTVAMMTAASMDSLRLCHTRLADIDLVVAVTTGLDNARRAGDRAEYRQLGGSPGKPGTINIAVVTGASVDAAAMVDALVTVTEAKAAVLQELGIRSPVSGKTATGTGTHAVAFFAGDGAVVPFAGKHTIFGERLAQLTMDAIRTSITEWEGAP